MCRTANLAAVSATAMQSPIASRQSIDDPHRCVQDAQGGTLHTTSFLGWLLIRVPSGWIQTRNVARISVRNCTHISTTNGTTSTMVECAIVYPLVFLLFFV